MFSVCYYQCLMRLHLDERLNTNNQSSIKETQNTISTSTSKITTTNKNTNNKS